MLICFPHGLKKDRRTDREDRERKRNLFIFLWTNVKLRTYCNERSKLGNKRHRFGVLRSYVANVCGTNFVSKIVVPKWFGN